MWQNQTHQLNSDNKARRARAYEMIYILRPSVHPDEADRIAARFSEIVTNLKGKLVNLSNWGRRRLAYPIKKRAEAYSSTLDSWVMKIWSPSSSVIYG